MAVDVEFEPVAPGSANPEVAVNIALEKLREAILVLDSGGGGGVSLPEGGTPGQVLAIGPDGSTLVWVTPEAAGLPTGGTAGQVLKIGPDGSTLVWGTDLQGSGGGGETPAGPFRYYRHTFKPAVANTGVAFGELTHYGSSVPVVPTVIAASSSYLGDTSTYGPARLIDGDTSTFWHQNNSTPDEWVVADFGSDVDIDKVRYTIADGRAVQRPGTLTVEARKDGGSTWALLYVDEVISYNIEGNGGYAELTFS